MVKKIREKNEFAYYLSIASPYICLINIFNKQRLALH